MNKKNAWLLLPTMIFPYAVLLTVATIFLATEQPFFRVVMERAFHNNALYLLAALLLLCLLAAALTITYFALSICKKWGAVSLAKGAMIVKWVHVPAYIGIFIAGVCCFITVFTIPFAIAFVLLDCFTLFLTGLLTLSAAVNAVRQGAAQTKEVLWMVILQFVFCADVISATLLYAKLRKNTGLSKGIHNENT
jgi:hypothetical protein